MRWLGGVAAFLLLAACSALGPEGGVPAPAGDPAYPSIGTVPAPRSDTLLTPEEQAKAQAELERHVPARR